ncbi:MAG: hypothetical protein ACKO0Z_20735, partial [Betaproteobacteria bacterium]
PRRMRRGIGRFYVYQEGGTMKKLRFDLTASINDNAILEYYLIDTAANFPIIPYQGQFYLVTPPSVCEIVNGAPGKALVMGTDYVPVGYDPVLSERSGKPVYSGILVFAKARVNKLGITFQYVGTKEAVNKNALQSAIQNLANRPITYSGISDIPTALPSISHTEQLANFSGWDSVVALLNDASGVYNTFMSQRHAGTGYGLYEANNAARIDFMESVISGINAGLPSAISNHIAGTGYSHVLKPANLGLDKVANYTFASAYTDANKLQYVSPKVLADMISHHGAAPDYTIHSHHETASDLGLGNVVNLGMVKTYSGGDYSTLGSSNLYVCGYVAANAVKEAATSAYATGFYAPVQASLSNALSAIASDAAAILAIRDQINAIAQVSVTAIAAQSEIISTSIEAQVVKYQQKNNNSLYAAVLSKLSDAEFACYSAGNNVYPNGVFPVPRELPWPALWLDPADGSTVTSLTDSGGITRVSSVRNKGVLGGAFKAPPGFESVLRLSSDLNQSTLGEASKVLFFEAGKYLRSDTPLDLTGKDFTIVALTQSIGGGSSVLLSGINGARVLFSSDFAIGIPGTASVPHLPANPANSFISIMQITQKNHFASSYGTSSTLSASAYSGLMPTNGFSSPIAALSTPPIFDSVGNFANSDSNTSFEITELIVYERILSVPELKALVKYLNYKHSKTLAYAISYPDSISS